MRKLVKHSDAWHTVQIGFKSDLNFDLENMGIAVEILLLCVIELCI